MISKEKFVRDIMLGLQKRKLHKEKLKRQEYFACLRESVKRCSKNKIKGSEF